MRPLPIPFDPELKVSTGITGLDEMTGGGLPRGRTTLLVGGPGSGKTILALQFLAHGANKCDEPGIFVAFEEASDQILANTKSFNWGLEELRKEKLFFLDAQPEFDMVQSGTFELSGMLAALGSKAKAMGARRIVFDAIDVVLDLLTDNADKKREIHRMHRWLLANRLTGIVTAKSGSQEVLPGEQSFSFMQFMMDCGVILTHDVQRGISLRKLRIQKYRGSRFDENEAPFRIENSGFAVAVARTASRTDVEVSNERLSSGVKALDEMLGGGFYRSTSVLISGYAGTAKTTLSAQFAETACRRGERTVIISFESDGSELIRNMAAVGIRLEPYVKSGQLRIVSARTLVGSGGSHLVRIKEIVEEHRALCLVIDPISSLCKGSTELPARAVAELLIDWSKANGINLISTHLHETSSSEREGGDSLNISTLADTWIQLCFVNHSGARNRGLTVVKSRGSAHSDRLREVKLAGNGFSFGGYYRSVNEGLESPKHRSTDPWVLESTTADEAATVAPAKTIGAVPPKSGGLRARSR